MDFVEWAETFLGPNRREVVIEFDPQQTVNGTTHVHGRWPEAIEVVRDAYWNNIVTIHQWQQKQRTVVTLRDHQCVVRRLDCYEHATHRPLSTGWLPLVQNLRDMARSMGVAVIVGTFAVMPSGGKTLVRSTERETEDVLFVWGDVADVSEYDLTMGWQCALWRQLNAVANATFWQSSDNKFIVQIHVSFYFTSSS
jgi:hypothetical protein